MNRFTETLHKGYGQSFEIERVLFSEKTEHQELVIFENVFFGRVMALDGVIQVTERDEFFYHEMMTHVPLFAHGAAKRVLIIGGGDGGILREVLRHPEVEQATMVELDRAVVDLALEYMPFISDGAFDDARTDLVIADGVDYVARTENRFDVVIVDSTDPIGPGEVLFTEQFYADCKRCLNTGGVIVTQNGVPFLQPTEITNSFQRLGKSFKDVGFYTVPVPTYVGGDMALGWGSDDATLRTLDVATIEARVNAANIKTRYYNPAIHVGAFALPNFVRELMK